MRTTRDQRMICCGMSSVPNWNERFYLERENASGNVACSYKCDDIYVQRTFKQDELMAVYIDIRQPLRGNGIGTKMFIDMVNVCREVGISRITCEAAQCDDDKLYMCGYYTWARMGYDGVIYVRNAYGTDVQAVPYNVKEGNSTVRNYIKKFGLEMWRSHGVTFEGTFDLSDDSYSMSTLRAYLNEKQIQGV